LRWRIDPDRSRIGFSVRHMVVTTIHGSFRGYRGSVEIDLTDFTRSRFEGEVDVASVDTGNRERDAELRRNEFFAVAQHPNIKFVSERIAARGRGLYELVGALEIRGVKRRVAVELEMRRPAPQASAARVHLKARGVLNRRDFGVSLGPVLEIGGLAVGDKVKLEVDVEAVAEGGKTEREGGV
jgi:polyisoprenoid-binding protein YceI